MVDWGQYANGANIDWRGFGEALLGGGLALGLTTFVTTLRNWFVAVVGLVTGFAEFLATTVAAYTGLSTDVWTGAFAQTEAFVAGLGVFGFVAAIAFLTFTFWVIYQEVSVLG